jgi:FtsH-binding integral membrane protein
MPANTLSKLIKGKEKFLISVYAILILQLTGTFVLLRAIRDHPDVAAATKKYFWLLALASLVLVFLVSWLPLPTWAKLLIFSVFSVLIAGVLNVVSARVSEELVNQALVSTIAIFVAMSALAVVLASFGVHLGWMGVYLLAALLGLIIASVVSTVFSVAGKNSPGARRMLLIIGMVLFSVFVVYDTNIVLQKDYSNSAVDAALDFYLNFINLFTRTLALDSSS